MMKPINYDYQYGLNEINLTIKSLNFVHIYAVNALQSKPKTT